MDSSSIVVNFWKRFFLRRTKFSNQFWRLRALYRLEDPWNMMSTKEQWRFEETNRLLLEWIGPVGQLVELGCGEGHQTTHLLRVARQIDGIDVSQSALRRASRRCPGVRFHSAELPSEALHEPGGADLVTMFEVLYYCSDPNRLLVDAERHGKHCVASFFDGAADQLLPLMERLPIIHSAVIDFEATRWFVFHWKSRIANERTNQAALD